MIGPTAKQRGGVLAHVIHRNLELHRSIAAVKASGITTVR